MITIIEISKKHDVGILFICACNNFYHLKNNVMNNIPRYQKQVSWHNSQTQQYN